MKKYTSLDKIAAREITRDLDTLLQTWAAERGLSVRCGGGSFGSMSFKPRIEFKVIATADGKSAAQVEFEQYCGAFGLQPEDFGRTYVVNGHVFTVTGLRITGAAKPIFVKKDDGKIYVASSDHVREMLGRKSQVTSKGGAQ